MLRSFTFFFLEIDNFCMTYETKKNAKNDAFFYKERKRTQRTARSFKKNGKKHKKRRILLLRMEKNAKNAAFFYKEPKRMQERCVLLKRTDAHWYTR